MLPISDTQESALPLRLDEPFDAHVSRPLAHVLAPKLLSKHITANQVSFAAALFGLAGGICLTKGSLWPVLGGLLLVGMVILDCTDGALARLSPPSEKPWKGRIIDGLADLVTILSVHVAMFTVLSRDTPSHDALFSRSAALIMVVLGFLSLSWKSSVLDDIKQRLKPHSIDKELDGYRAEVTSFLDRILFSLLRFYIKVAQNGSGKQHPGGKELFQRVAWMGPSHHLVLIAISGLLLPRYEAVFAIYLFMTVVPGNLLLYFFLKSSPDEAA